MNKLWIHIFEASKIYADLKVALLNVKSFLIMRKQIAEWIGF